MYVLCFKGEEESLVSDAAIKYNHNILDYCLRNAQLIFIYFKETKLIIYHSKCSRLHKSGYVKYMATLKLNGISMYFRHLFNFCEGKCLNSYREEGALLRCVFGCNPRGFLGFSRAGATENKLLAKLIHVPHLGFTQIKMNILWNNNGSIILIPSTK